MTATNRLYFECTDIRLIELECRKWGTSISYPPDKWEPTDTLKCPNCSVTLIVGPIGKSEEMIAVQELAASLKRLRANKFEFRLRMEFDAG